MNTRVICDAIRFDGMSVNHAAIASGVGQSTLHRFCEGSRGMQLAAFETVCESLGLQLVRTYDSDELQQHLDDMWSDGRDDLFAADYEPEKTDAWNEYISDAWKEYSANEWESSKSESMATVAEENEYDLNDTSDVEACETEAFRQWEADEYETWEAAEYETWTAAYDEEHLADWEKTARTEFNDEEISRMKTCDWILLL